MRNRNFNYYEYNPKEWKNIIVTLIFVVLNLAGFIYGEIEDMAPYNYGMMVQPVEQNGEYYRIFTYMFLHFGLQHFLMNMISLFGLGRILENCVGHIKMLVIYLISGIGGGAMICYIGDEYSLTVGASGAIFGLMGALIVYMVLNRDASMLYQMVLLLMINLISTFTEETISIGGHLGGLAAGLVIGVLLIRREEEKKWYEH